MSSRRAKKHFGPVQPQPGDGVLMCAHSDLENPPPGESHFWKLPEPTEFRNRRGPVLVSWLVACQECFEKHAQEPLRIHFTHFANWSGNAPVIEAQN